MQVKSNGLGFMYTKILVLMSRKGQVCEGMVEVYSFPDWNRTTSVPKSVPVADLDKVSNDFIMCVLGENSPGSLMAVS